MFLCKHGKQSLSFVIVILILFLYSFIQAQGITKKLNPKEKKWLSQHPVIKIAPDPDFPPIEFFDQNGIYKGLAADYVKIIEKKLSIKFKVIHCRDWNEVLEKVRNREVDCLPAAAQTPKRHEYLLFSDPHIVLPGVIITRRSFKRDFSLGSIKNLKVSVVKSYVWHEFLSRDYPTMPLQLVSDLQTGLKKVSLGETDALIATLPVAIYYIEKEGINNLRVAGKTGYYTKLSFAVRKDWPELHGIIQKILSQVTTDKKQAILHKWIHLGNGSLFLSGTFWLVLLICLAVFGCIIIAVLIWNLYLKRQVRLRTRQLEDELVQRKEIEKSLRVSEERYSAFVDHVPAAVFFHDKDSRTLYVNKYMREVLGAHHWIGKTLFEIFPEKTARSLREHDGITWREGYLSAEEAVKDKDGNDRIYETRKFLINQKDEEMILGGIAWDITARKRALNDLAESEAQLKAIFNAVTKVSFITTDLAGSDARVLNFSPGSEKIFGYKKEEVLGKPVAIFHEPGIVNKFPEIIEKLQRGEAGFEGETTLVRKSGEKFPALFTAYPLFNSRNELKGILNVSIDITRQKQLEERIRQSEKMEALGQLAGGIAHDFNNQLFGILGYTEMIRKQIGYDEVLVKYTDRMLLSIEHASDLTKKLLAFARKEKEESVPVDMNNLLNDVISLLEMCNTNKKTEIKKDLSSDSSMIFGDPSKLHNALLNLGLNAQDAMPDGGEIIFSSEVVELGEKECESSGFEITPGPYLKLCVKDTGTGMTEEVQKHIFEPFFTTKEKGKGTGMGLVSVYGTVASHKGTVEVKSDPGKGTTFTIYLPFLKGNEVKEEDKTASSSDAPSGRKRHHILIAEDENMLSKMCCGILKRQGYKVSSCKNGREAVDIYKNLWQEIDIVILDLVMPEMGGKEAFLEMRKINPGAKVIMSSGYSLPENPQKLLREGVASFIEKPYSKEKLLAVIAETLGNTAIKQE